MPLATYSFRLAGLVLLSLLSRSLGDVAAWTAV